MLLPWSDLTGNYGDFLEVPSYSQNYNQQKHVRTKLIQQTAEYRVRNLPACQR